MKAILGAALAAAMITTAPPRAAAHGGGLNAEGCHNDRKGGTGYHCHRGGSAKRARSTPSRSERASFTSGSSRGAYANCSEARAAGASNIRRGEAGYGPHLDRDDDGIACER